MFDINQIRHIMQSKMKDKRYNAEGAKSNVQPSLTSNQQYFILNL